MPGVFDVEACQRAMADRAARRAEMEPPEAVADALNDRVRRLYGQPLRDPDARPWWRRLREWLA
ncbi:MAG: hypothetical protein ACU0CO_10180 [Shimia sp.]